MALKVILWAAKFDCYFGIALCCDYMKDVLNLNGPRYRGKVRAPVITAPTGSLVLLWFP